MKNVIKKIAATVMAMTLLATGTTVSKTLAPRFDNVLTASAASSSSCSHVTGSTSWSSWKTVDTKWRWYLIVITETEYQERTCKCVRCGKTVQTQKRHRIKSYCEERTQTSPWYYD